MRAPDAIHRPVMLAEVVAALAPRPGGRYVDATLGLGGHAEAILERSSPDGALLGVDRDPRALALARERLARFGARVRLEVGKFSELKRFVAAPVDGLVADLGISSLELDDPERGFSLRREGPLDMRMSDQGETAGELLQRLTETELVTLLAELGEVERPRRVARAILDARDAGRLSTTLDLTRAVEAGSPARGRSLHPATLVFQALRMAVNDELGELERLLAALPTLVAPGGKVAILTFHSLEDRRVKHALRGPAVARRRYGEAAKVDVPFLAEPRRAVRPSEAELAENPRARSAKLRVFVRTEVPS